MYLKEQISSDIKIAMKSADSFRLGVLRLLSSAFQNEAIAKRTRKEEGDLTEEEVIAVLKREAKKRKESIDIYSQAKRGDLLENEERELKIIQEYLPQEATREEVELAIVKIIESGVSDFPTIMKTLIADFKGSLDAKQASQIIRQKLE